MQSQAERRLITKLFGEPLPITWARIPSVGKLLLWIFFGVVAFGPLLVGVLPIVPGALVPALVWAFSVYASYDEANIRAKRIAITALSVCVTVTLTELAVRPLMAYLRDDRPEAISPHHLPRLPQVSRYLKNVNYRGSYYGDLAIMARRKEWREYRDLWFVTDRFGFRNQNAEFANESSALDLIMLGDSFGEGLGTTQQSTWSSILDRDYGLKTYNLSVDGAGPWQEYINLLLEIDRLNTNERTIVLWALFTGNDLYEEYYPQLERDQLPWLSPFGSILYEIQRFRWNSELRRTILLGQELAEAGDRVLARNFLDRSPFLFYRNYSKVLSLSEIQSQPNFARLDATMSAMSKLGREKHLTVVVVLIPSKEEIYSWVLNGTEPWNSSKEPSGFSLALKALCTQRQFTYLDLKPPLIDASKEVYEHSNEPIYWRDDTHWNVRGHNSAAAIVYRELLLPMRNVQLPQALSTAHR